MKGLKNFRIIAACLFMSVGTATSHAQALEDYSLCNKFAFDLFREAALSHDENIVFSPLSLEVSLAMLQNGAKGNTQTELKEAIGMGHLSSKEINEYFKAMLDQVNREIVPECSSFIQGDYLLFKMANSIWVDESASLNPSYCISCSNWYNSEVFRADLKSEAANMDIDTWIKEKIGMSMPSIGISPNENLSMLLLNTMVFNGEWNERFSKEKVKDEVFTNKDRSRVMVPTMYKHFDYHLSMTDNFDMIEIPIIAVNTPKARFSMYFYLPQYEDAELTQEEHDQLQRTKEFLPAYLYLPKFSIDDNHSLLELLKKLGIHDAFSPIDADFSGIMSRSVENLYLNSIIQPCHLEIDEQGVKAASVTRVGGIGYGLKEGVAVFRFNRPFYFTLEDNEANVILYCGRINHLDGPEADPGVEPPASVERLNLEENSCTEGSFDLSGRRMTKANQQGIVIENGRKVLR